MEYLSPIKSKWGIGYCVSELKVAVRLPVEAFEERDHEPVAFRGDALSLPGMHPAFDVAQLHHELPVGGVFLRVGLGFREIGPLIVHPGADFAGEEERPADPDGSDGIQLVGVEKNPGLESGGGRVLPEAVGLDAVGDPGDPRLGHTLGPQDSLGEPGPRFGMADAAVRPVFLVPADVVEDSRELQDAQIGLFLAADPEAEVEDALGMVPVMAAPGVPENSLRLPPDAGVQRFDSDPGFAYFDDRQLNL